MAGDPLSTNQPVVDQLKEVGLPEDKAHRLLELLRDGGYIDFTEQMSYGRALLRVRNARLTHAGLAALDLWPADGEEVSYLIDRLGDALESTAEELADEGGSDEDVGRVRAARGVLMEFGARTLAAYLDYKT